MNPNLLPYESENLDVSAEWYYDDVSYVSVGYYQRRVELGFVDATLYNHNFFNFTVPHPGQGVLVDEAKAVITAAGGDPMFRCNSCLAGDQSSG